VEEISKKYEEAIQVHPFPLYLFPEYLDLEGREFSID